MAYTKKTKRNWKTKDDGSRRYMICQNSNLEFSKYSDFAPGDGMLTCKEWVEVAKNTDAVLCSTCTHQSVIAHRSVATNN
jgi:hypothetical protein